MTGLTQNLNLHAKLKLTHKSKAWI